MRKGLFIFCVCLFVFSLYSKAQVGKEFWFVAPDVTKGHGDEPIMFRITALETSANVTVSMPANGSYSPVTINVPAYTQKNFVLDKNIVENQPSNTINNKGILVSSDVDITAYYEVANGVNPDKFTLKGHNGLGREFYVPSQNLYRNKPLRPIGDEKVDIVATEDNTTISIVPTANIVGHAANAPFTITLNKGQTFCLENQNDYTASSSLAGTSINSDKYVAVTISDDSVWEEYNLYGNAAGPYDLIGDQLIPTTVIGNEYIGINTSTDARTINKVFVLATQDDTYITINNDPTLIKGPYQTGEQVDFDITDNAIYIRSNHPVYAYQLASFWNRSGNEIGSAILPSMSCTGSETVSFVRSFSKKFYTQLMTQGKNIRSFVFKDQGGNTLDNLTDVIFDQDGNSYSDLNSITWTAVKGTDGGNADDIWYTAVVSLSITTSVPYTIANSNGLFHMSILDENQGSTSYGYFSSYGQLRLEGPTQECRGNQIILRTADPMKSYNWFSEHKAGIQSTDSEFTVTESGKYWVTAEVNFGGCFLTDSLEVEFLLPEFDLGPDEVVCPDETIRIGVDNGLGNYEWSDGSTSNEISLTLSPEQTSTISLTVTDDFNCSNTDSKEVTTHPLSVIALNKTEVCEGDMVINQTNLVRYEWRFNGSLLNLDDTQNFIIPSQTGRYTLTAWGVNGCPVTESFDITVRPLPGFDIADQLGCVATTTIVDAPTGFGYQYLWSDGSTLDHIELNAPADIKLEITDQYGCVATDDFNFDFLPPAPFDLGRDREECAGITLTIDQGADYTNYNWKFQAGVAGPIVDLPTPTPEHAYEIDPATAAHSGRYYVTAIDKEGCEVIDDVDVSFVNAPAPDLGLSQNLCTGEEITISTSTGYTDYIWHFEDLLGVRTELASFEDDNEIKVSTQGKYIVEASIGGCTKTNEVTVSEYANPTVQLQGDKLCNNGTVDISIDNFNAAGSSTFDYLIWNGEQRRFNDWNIASLTVDAAGVYSVTAYDNIGCKTTESITIDPYPETLLELGVPQETCENIAITLTNPESTAARYEWFRIGSGGNIVGPVDADWSVSSSGSYRLLITDVNGCEVSDTVIVKTLPVPVVDLGADREMCVGDEIVLETDIEYEEYRWNDDFALNQKSLIVNATGNYKLEVKNAHGCWAIDNVLITANPLPVLGLSDHAECAGVEVVLSAPAGLTEVKWSTGETSQAITVLNGSYTLEATNPKGCVGRATAVVKWHDTPKIDLGEDVFICPVDFMELVAPDGFDNYVWHNESTAKSIIANFADTVNVVRVQDANDCWGFDTRMVKALPEPEYELCPDTAVCTGDTVVLDAGADYLEYLWFDDSRFPTYTVRQSGEYWVKVLDGCFWLQDTTAIVYNETPVIAKLDTAIYGQVAIFPEGGTEPYRYALNDEDWQDENVFKKLENGTFIIQVEDFNTCMASDTIMLNSIIDIDVPNFFTPNKDGFNDVWEIEGLDKFPDSMIRIYDRFGKLLIEYKASEPGWNGEYLGKPVSSDAYWYVIEVLPVEKYLKGHITLKR